MHVAHPAKLNARAKEDLLVMIDHQIYSKGRSSGDDRYRYAVNCQKGSPSFSQSDVDRINSILCACGRGVHFEGTLQPESAAATASLQPAVDATCTDLPAKSDLKVNYSPLYFAPHTISSNMELPV